MARRQHFETKSDMARAVQAFGVPQAGEPVAADRRSWLQSGAAPWFLAILAVRRRFEKPCSWSRQERSRPFSTSQLTSEF